MPINICHIITDLGVGGAERSLVNLVTRLDPARFRNEVVSLLELGPMAQPLAAAGIPVTTLRMRRGRPSVSALTALIRHLRIARPAIVQTWLYHADLVGTVAAWFARSDKLLWNVRCTDMTQAPTESSIRWLVRTLALLSRFPDAIVVNSHSGRHDHETLGYRPQAWAEIPNGVDTLRFRVRRTERAQLRARLGLADGITVIGLVARYHPMKDVQTFLRGAALMADQRADVQFVLCGAGFDAANGPINVLISELNLGSRVVLLGQRSDPEDIYPALDILTLCSIYGEGFPNVLCEAMACGVPCVATDVGDSASILGEAGVVVPKRDPQALAAAWTRLLGAGAELRGDKGRDRIENNFSLDLMRDRYSTLYEAIAANGPPPSV